MQFEKIQQQVFFLYLFRRAFIIKFKKWTKMMKKNLRRLIYAFGASIRLMRGQFMWMMGVTMLLSLWQYAELNCDSLQGMITVYVSLKYSQGNGRCKDWRLKRLRMRKEYGDIWGKRKLDKVERDTKMRNMRG